MVERLVTIFYAIVITSCNRRRVNISARAYWQPIKEVLAKANIRAPKWLSLPEKLVSDTMMLPEYDGGMIIEKNHFKIQQVRIPTTEVPTLEKIIQVALNIGYSSADGMPIITDLNQLISKEDITEISNQITDELFYEIKSKI